MMQINIINFNQRTKIAKVRIKGHKVITVQPELWECAGLHTTEDRDNKIKEAAIKIHNTRHGFGVVMTTQTAG